MFFRNITQLGTRLEPCECSIEPPGSINQGVIDIVEFNYFNIKHNVLKAMDCISLKIKNSFHIQKLKSRKKKHEWKII